MKILKFSLSFTSIFTIDKRKLGKGFGDFSEKVKSNPLSLYTNSSYFIYVYNMHSMKKSSKKIVYMQRFSLNFTKIPKTLSQSHFIDGEILVKVSEFFTKFH